MKNKMVERTEKRYSEAKARKCIERNIQGKKLMANRKARSVKVTERNIDGEN